MVYHYPLFLLLLISASLLGQKNVTISGTFEQCKSGEISVFEHDGIELRTLAKVPLIKNEQGSFDTEINLEIEDPGIYYLGKSNNNRAQIYLGRDQQINVSGVCSALGQITITGSPSNLQFYQAIREGNTYQQQLAAIVNKIREAESGSDEFANLTAGMEALALQRRQQLKTLEDADRLIYLTAALRAYVPYVAGNEEYESEALYFAHQFFANTPLEDPVYSTIPLVVDAFREYVHNIQRVGLSKQEQIRHMDRELYRMEPGSRAYKFALSGIITSVQGDAQLLSHFGPKFIEHFTVENPAIAGRLQQRLSQLSASIPGSEAPEIAELTPDNDTLRLSDLRGKVILIDFWASWCGPCRRVNPEMVRLYNKYHEHGFDILGVSLDRSRAPWLKAIEDDNLTWHHVSDLKGWQSRAAGIYGVSSIPQTFLVDEEGRIIAHNLKGRELEQKLDELLFNN